MKQDVVDAVVVGLEQSPDLQRRMLAKVSHQLARFVGMHQTSSSLAAKPTNNRDSAVTKDHQRVVRITHHSGQLRFQNLIQERYRCDSIQLLLRHNYLQGRSAKSVRQIQNPMMPPASSVLIMRRQSASRKGQIDRIDSMFHSPLIRERTNPS